MWTTSPTERVHRRALVLLAIGSVVGVLSGIFSAWRATRISAVSTLPNDAVALVNGKPIREDEFTNAVALVAGDKRDLITDDDRAHVLHRLIEEELLVQQGVRRGLVDSDRAIRKTLSTAMLDAIMAESASAQPTEEELRIFYAQHLSLFQDSTPEKDAAREPPFADVKEQVEVVYLQRMRDDALRDYLNWLRSEAKIVLALEER